MVYGQKTVVIQADQADMAGVALDDIGTLVINWKKRSIAGLMAFIWIDGEPVDVAQISASSQMVLPLPKGTHRLGGGAPRERKAEIAVEIVAGQTTTVSMEYGVWLGKITFADPASAGPVALDGASLAAAVKKYIRVKKLAAAAVPVLSESNTSLRGFSDRLAVVYKHSWFSFFLLGGLFGNAARDAVAQKYIFEVEEDGCVTCRVVKNLSDVPGVYT